LIVHAVVIGLLI